MFGVVVLLAIVAAVTADLTLVDRSEPARICKAGMYAVNVTGLGVGAANSAIQMAASAWINVSESRVELGKPLDLYAIPPFGASSYGGNVRNTGTNVTKLVSFQIGITNGSIRSYTSSGCNQAFCELTGYPSSSCLSFSGDPEQPGCLPLTLGSKLGNVALASSTASPGYTVLRMEVPRPNLGSLVMDSCYGSFMTCALKAAITPDGVTSCEGSSYQFESDMYNLPSSFFGLCSNGQWTWPYVLRNLLKVDTSSTISACMCHYSGHDYWFEGGALDLIRATGINRGKIRVYEAIGGVRMVSANPGCSECMDETCRSASCNQVISETVFAGSCAGNVSSDTLLTYKSCFNSTWRIGYHGSVPPEIRLNNVLTTGVTAAVQRGPVEHGPSIPVGNVERLSLLETNGSVFVEMPTQDLDPVDLLNAILGLGRYAYPAGWPRAVLYSNYTLVEPEGLTGILDFVGDIASGLFGLATTDDIEDLVDAAESALKGSMEALSLVQDLADSVGAVVENLEDQYWELTDRYLKLDSVTLEIEQSVLDLEASTRAATMSLQTYVNAQAKMQNLVNRALWANSLDGLISRVISDQSVSPEDPFIDSMIEAYDSLSSEDEWPEDLNLGAGNETRLSLSRKLTKTILPGSTTWVVYRVPLCQTGSFSSYKVSVAESQSVNLNGGYVSPFGAILKSVGFCVNGSSGMIPVATSVDRPIEVDQVLTSVPGMAAGLTMKLCLETLTGMRDYHLIGDLGDFDGSVSRSVWEGTPSDINSLRKGNSSLAIVSLGPCQYNLQYGSARSVRYIRPGMSTIEGKGNDLISLAPGASLIIEVDGAESGTLDCTYGSAVTSIVTGAGTSQMVNSVLALSTREINVSDLAVADPISFRDHTVRELSDQAARSREISENLDEIRKRAQESYDDANRALSKLNDIDSCSMVDFSGCEGLTTFFYCILWIAIAGMAIYILGNARKATRAGGAAMKLAMVSGANALLEGDGNGTTTVITTTTTAGSSSTTTTTSTAPATSTGPCLIEWSLNSCNVVSLGDECDRWDRLYAAMFWFTLVASSLLLAYLWFNLSRMGWKRLAELAFVQIKSNLSDEWKMKDTRRYDLFCTSKSCAGRTKLLSAKIVKVGGLHGQKVGYYPHDSVLSDTACRVCGASFGTPTPMYDDNMMRPLLSPETGIFVDGKVKLIKDVPVVECTFTTLTAGAGSTYGLDAPERKAQMQEMRGRVRPYGSNVIKAGAAYGLASLATVNGQVWRDGCKMNNFSGQCCRSEEVSSFILHWILFGILGLITLSIITRIYAITAVTMKRTLTRFFGLVLRMGGAATVAVSLGHIPGADAQIAVTFVDSEDCRFGDWSSCSTGHIVVYSIISILSLIFAIGAIIVLMRIIGILRGIISCLKFRKTKKMGEDEKLADTVRTLIEALKKN